MRNIFILILLVCEMSSLKVNAQNGEIKSFKKISATSGNFSGLPDGYIYFGNGISEIGDLDKDGIIDFAVGVYNQNTLEGNVFILFMNKNGTVKTFISIGSNIGGLNGTFLNMLDFGKSISLMGDIDGDGNNDLVVGNSRGGGNNTGQVFILFLNSNGTVKKFSIIGNSAITLINNESFGWDVKTHGDLNGDGINEILVCSPGNKDGGLYSGIIYILFINSNGQLIQSKKISSSSGGFKGVIGGGLAFSVASISDLNRDGFKDIVVSSNTPPALWVLFLDSFTKVKQHQKIGIDSGSYSDMIKSSDIFGYNLLNVGDIDTDGNSDIAVSSTSDSVNGYRTGRVRILFLNQNGTVKSIKRIDNNTTNFSGVLKDEDNFGSGLSGGFDLDGDFKNDLLVGARYSDDGGTDKGAIYLLSLDGAVHPTPPKALWRVNATSGNQNTVFNFTQYSTGFPNAYKWSISPNTFTYQSGTSDTSANPIIKFNQTANYSVQLKVTNLFSADSLLRSSYINVQKVGVNNVEKNNTSISIFPNPTNGLVQIQSPINIQTILVFDITGKQLLQQEPNTQTDEINISNLPQGLYQIHIQTEMGVVVKKLVKE
jgi:PKD repeat protein